MSRILEAIDFAMKAHAGQKRKALNIPYIVHPLEVWTILIREGADEETQIAGLLHDTVEDTTITNNEILLKFGMFVSNYVAQLTEAKKEGWTPEQKKSTWRERKMENLLRVTDKNAKLIKLADRVSNSRDLVREYRKYGDEIWKSFNMSESGQKWYYVSTLDRLREFSQSEAYQELWENVVILFGIGAVRDLNTST